MNVHLDHPDAVLALNPAIRPMRVWYVPQVPNPVPEPDFEGIVMVDLESPLPPLLCPNYDDVPRGKIVASEATLCAAANKARATWPKAKIGLFRFPNVRYFHNIGGVVKPWTTLDVHAVAEEIATWHVTILPTLCGAVDVMMPVAYDPYPENMPGEPTPEDDAAYAAACSIIGKAVADRFFDVTRVTVASPLLFTAGTPIASQSVDTFRRRVVDPIKASGCDDIAIWTGWPHWINRAFAGKMIPRSAVVSAMHRAELPDGVLPNIGDDRWDDSRRAVVNLGVDTYMAAIAGMARHV